MTEIYVLDRNFAITALIDGFETLIWNRRYGRCGSYELHLPTGELFETVDSGKYLYRADTAETALIERVEFIRNDNGGNKVVVSGRMLETVLGDRVIFQTTDISGNAEMAIRELVAKNAVSGTAAAGREIAGLKLGEVNGIGGDVALQLGGENLLEAVENICEEQDISVKIELNFAENSLNFTVWQGKDRTTAQRINSWAIFSDDFENINASGYEKDSSDFKNYAFVKGVKANETEIMVEVDNRSDSTEERREIFVDATDADQEVDGKTMSESEFVEVLRQRGLEALAEYPMIEAANGDIRGGGNLIYRQDFDLGDLCEFVDNEVGIMAVGRISEITETIENNTTEIAASIGKDGQTMAKKIIRRERSR